MDLEKTLVLIKPDAIERGLVGQIIHRFETVGLKIVGLKMLKPDQKFALDHYGDIAVRHGQKIQDQLLDFLTSGPVVAFALEGVEAIETVRKMVGPTEPKAAPPGTIRGDFAHVSYGYADERNIAVKNIIHASASIEDAKRELVLWFKPDELCVYRTVGEKHLYN
jgi:nucleoside-diphosphate kinase